jgi:replicative DNA helicase
LLEGANVLHIVGEDLIADIQGMYVAVTGAGNAALQNLWFLDMLDATFGIREVEAGIEASKKADKIPDIVVLDNLDLMHLSSYKPDVQGITEMCRELKLLAKRQDVIMITSSLSNFSRENRGLARLYGAKVGKSANMDVVIMIDDVKFSEYDMTLAKRRGKKTSEENAHKVIECNWDNMTTSEVL